MGRLVKPGDIKIFGRTKAMKHDDKRDSATKADIKLREFKKYWLHYIRVHHAEFLAGTLEHGVSINKLMIALGADSFASTQRNARTRQGNTDPRRAYSQQPHVELTSMSIQWLNRNLNEAFEKHGRLSQAEMSKLDWPSVG